MSRQAKRASPAIDTGGGIRTKNTAPVQRSPGAVFLSATERRGRLLGAEAVAADAALARLDLGRFGAALFRESLVASITLA